MNIGGFHAPETVNAFARHYGFSAPRVLLSIRNGEVTDWPTLCARFGVSPTSKATAAQLLSECVALLAKAGLITRDDGALKPAERLPEILTALDLSLQSLALAVPGRSLLVTPPFQFTPVTDTPGLFAVLPFQPAFRELYDDVLMRAAQDVGLPLHRADDLFGPRSIINDIWSWILSSRVIIADCTQRNPNVFYEIGVAHCIGRPVILIAQSDDDVPFDLKHLRYLKYSFTPRGAELLRQALVSSIREIIDSQASPHP